MSAAGKTASLEALSIQDVATLFSLIKNVFPLYEFEQIADIMLRTQEVGQHLANRLHTTQVAKCGS